MLQERVEGKWLAAFRRVFTLNGIARGTRVAILSETPVAPGSGASGGTGGL